MAKSRSTLSIIRAINSNNQSSAVSRRRFIRRAAVSTAGAALMIGNAGNLLAGSKDVGQITLDGLLITYFGSPLGTDGSVNYTFRPGYSMTLGFRSLNNPDITLSAGAPPEGKGVGQGVRVAASQQVENALTVYPHSLPNERFGVTVRQPALPENTAFYGFARPVFQVKGNGGHARISLVDPAITFVSNVTDLTNLVSQETADSMRSQYVFDPAALVAPRYSLAFSATNGFATTARAENKAPLDLTTTMTARVTDQTGFESDAFKQAFAVGSTLEVTYYARQDSHGKVLDIAADLQSTTPHISQFYWDRILRTFVMV